MPPEGYHPRRGYESVWGMPYYPMFYPDGSARSLRTKAEIQSDLEAALDVENYELAAKLRDELFAKELE